MTINTCESTNKFKKKQSMHESDQEYFISYFIQKEWFLVFKDACEVLI